MSLDRANSRLSRVARVILCAMTFWAPISARGQFASWPDLSVPPSAVGGGEKDAAVIVGAENYAFVAKVPGARKNAEDWQSYLTETLKIPAERVALLRDNEATDAKMRRFAAQAAAQVEAGGTLWFVFIGHGAPSKDGKDGLLVGVDAQQDPDGLYARSVPRDELLDILSKGKQGKTVVLIDACFSGRGPSGETLTAGLQPLILVEDRIVAADPRIILLTAAKSDQFAGPLPQSAQPLPAFSYLVLGALRGWAADASGRVTASAVVDFARRALSLDKGRVQTPQLTAGAAATILGLGRESAPDLGKIGRERIPAEDGFRMSDLPSMPQPDAPKELSPEPSAVDLSATDVDALEKYDEAVKFDKSGAAPEDKAENWRRFAKEAPKWAETAAKRAGEWNRFAAEEKEAAQARERRYSARDSDWEKLERLLMLGVVPEAEKTAWSGQFVNAYMKSPGLEPGMAKALAAYVPAGAVREALDKRALEATEQDVPRQGPAGIHWMKIPSGNFRMGAENAGGDALPTHDVAVPGFWMAKTLVTRAQYKACVEARACTPPGCLWPAAPGEESLPVVCVDWDQARAFSKWAGGRLPSEAEWEYAARGAGQQRKYPWGDEEATCERAVISGCSNGVAFVCAKPSGNTPQGLCDMAGDVWEWVQDWYHGSYDGAPKDGSAWVDPAGSGRVVRGGSWFYDARYARSAYRVIRNPSDRSEFLGFRPVR